jgi:environmental stress-induced protein Ves
VTATAERIALRRIDPQPWKNGCGLTRELAMAPPDAAMDDFDWRLSIAAVARDAPFSAFPGVDRCIVLLDGAGLLLRTDSASHRLDRPFVPLAFSGDEPVQAELIEGATTDFNVMVRRGRWRAEVDEVSAAPSPPADAGLLLCWHGGLQVHAPDGPSSLPGQHALLWRHGLPALSCAAESASTRALLVRLNAL